MKKSIPAAIFLFTQLAIWVPCGPATGDEPGSRVKAIEDTEMPAHPVGLAPLVGIAAALPKDADDSRAYAWSLRLRVPKVVWEIVGEERPKLEWSGIKADVEMVTLEVQMGYSESTQLAEQGQNRLVDLEGRRLTREEAFKRLGEGGTVLVSVSGEMPDPFYLECSKPDTLIVLFGLPSSREYNLLPTSRMTRHEAPVQE